MDRPSPEEYPAQLLVRHLWRTLLMLAISVVVWSTVADGQSDHILLIDIALGIRRIVLVSFRRRAQITREMHVLAHRISQISMHAGALAFRQDLGAVEMRDSAAVIQEKAHEALTDLRGVFGVRAHRPGARCGSGRGAGLQQRGDREGTPPVGAHGQGARLEAVFEKLEVTNRVQIAICAHDPGWD